MDLTVGVHSMAPVGGTEINAFQVARGLAQRGHVVDLLAARDGALAGEYRMFCRTVTRCPTFDFARATGLRDLVRMVPAVVSAARRRPDVVYPNRFAEIVWAAAVGRLTGAPVVCHLHEIRHARPGAFPNDHVRRFIAVSEFLRRQWVEVGLSPDHIDVVHNGVSCDDYPMGEEAERVTARARLHLPQHGFVALYYGRLDPEKGIDVLLEAWRRLGIGGKQGTLLVVGSPSAHLEDGTRFLERLRATAPPGCVWLPAQSDVLGPLHAADVVVVPSLWAEPFGRVIVEAMATGRPAPGLSDRRNLRDPDGRVREVSDGARRPGSDRSCAGVPHRLAGAGDFTRRSLPRPCEGQLLARPDCRWCGAIAPCGRR